jgi:hypothetical protein
MVMGNVLSVTVVSSDHWTRSCSRRASGKESEKASALIIFARLSSTGNGRGASSGFGRTSAIEGISRTDVVSVASRNRGHSSRVCLVSISYHQ